ncbi:IPT/TIG domain-containing protein [Actinoplanes cyaneus]|nr:IPT/TIG domain-containing protein [Actinoplanes cyaneus]
MDSRGNPVAGATVTLLRASTPLGPFLPLAADSPYHHPPVNPQLTDASGTFRWDVLSGYYKVTASAPNCGAPGTGERVAETPALPVPPPQVGLVITLSCIDEKPAVQPAITSLSTSVGPSAGGADIVISGRGFSPAATVSIAGTTLDHVQFLSPTALAVRTPPGRGTADFRVRTGGGTSAISAADRYTFQPARTAPIVSAVSPRSGPEAGGTTVTVTGRDLADATAVKFGTLPGTHLHCTANSCSVSSPPGTGTVDVTVVTPGGTSAATARDRFAYRAAGPVSRPGVRGHTGSASTSSVAGHASAGSATGAAGTGTGGGGSALPTTGAPVIRLIVLGFLLICAGSVITILLRIRRRHPVHALVRGRPWSR